MTKMRKNPKATIDVTPKNKKHPVIPTHESYTYGNKELYTISMTNIPSIQRVIALSGA